MARKSAIGALFTKNPIVGVVFVVGLGIVGYFGLKKLFGPKLPPRPKIRAGTAKGLPMGWSPYPLVAQLKKDMTGFGWGVIQRKSWITLAELPTNDISIVRKRN